MIGPAPRRRGFSLLEVILALALIAAVTAATFEFLDGLGRRSRSSRELASRLAGADAAFEQLDDALQTTFVEGPARAAGVAGEGRSLIVRSYASPPGRAPGVRTIRLRGEGGALLGTLGEHGDEPLIDPAVIVRFRYHDGAGWQSSFDSAAQRRLPTALEISLWFGEEPASAATPASNTDPDAAPGVPARAPDRQRIFAIPDAPPAAGGNEP